MKNLSTQEITEKVNEFLNTLDVTAENGYSYTFTINDKEATSVNEDGFNNSICVQGRAIGIALNIYSILEEVVKTDENIGKALAFLITTKASSEGCECPKCTAEREAEIEEKSKGLMDFAKSILKNKK